MIGPPAKATSMRTESGESGNGYDLRENTVNGVGVDKGNLQTEEAEARCRVDQFRTGGGKIGEGLAQIGDFVGDMVDARATLGEESTDGRVFGERGEQLDPACSEKHGSRLDALIGNDIAVLELATKQRRVGRDRIVEVGHRNAEMVDSRGLHTADATSRRVSEAAGSELESE